MQIAKRRPYAEHLRLFGFYSYKDAEEAFFKSYGNKVDKSEFRVNYLYKVRDSQIYTVFSTSKHVGITDAKYPQQYISGLLSNWNDSVCMKHGLEYMEAVEAARVSFQELYGNPELYIEGPIPINKIITLQDVLTRNKME